MKAEWFYRRGTQEFGPFEATTLKGFAADGTISPSDEVFGPGLKQWIPAHKVKGLLPKQNGSDDQGVLSSDEVLASATHSESQSRGRTNRSQGDSPPDTDELLKRLGSQLAKSTKTVEAAIYTTAITTGCAAVALLGTGLAAYVYHLSVLDNIIYRRLDSLEYRLSGVLAQSQRLSIKFAQNQEARRLGEKALDRLCDIYAEAETLQLESELFRKHALDNLSKQRDLSDKPQRPADAKAVGPFEAYMPYESQYEQLKARVLVRCRERVYRTDKAGRELRQGEQHTDHGIGLGGLRDEIHKTLGVARENFKELQKTVVFPSEKALLECYLTTIGKLDFHNANFENYWYMPGNEWWRFEYENGFVQPMDRGRPILP